MIEKSVKLLSMSGILLRFFKIDFFTNFLRCSISCKQGMPIKFHLEEGLREYYRVFGSEYHLSACALVQ